jgi:hypothetical protein
VKNDTSIASITVPYQNGGQILQLCYEHDGQEMLAALDMIVQEEIEEKQNYL